MDRISRRSRGVEGVRFGDFRIGFLLFTGRCGPAVTSSSHWIGSQQSVKRPGWKSAPPNLRQWFSTGERWTAFFRSGRRSCPKWRSSSTLRSCSRVRGKWSDEIDRRIGAGSAPVLRGEEGAEPIGKALCLPVDLHSYPHLWSRALGSDQKNKIAGTGSCNELPSKGGRALL